MPPSSPDRPVFVVNMEVYLRRGDRCLLIRRGEGMSNAAGKLAGVGGKAEVAEGEVGRDGILEETARREVAEMLWITAAEAAEHAQCPAWTAQSLRKVFEPRSGG